MLRNLLGIGCVFLAALVLVGITFSASKDAPADFRFVNGTEPKSLDPHIMTGQPEGRIADAIFEGLMYRDPKTLRPVPGVAREPPEISADRKTYTFRLRENARWSDGQPITAHDFAWSWRRLQRPDLGSEYAYIHHMIRLAEIYNTYGVNAHAIDEDLRPGLEDLRKAHPEGVDAKAWQAFLADVKAAEALKNVADPLLREVLSLRAGRVTAQRLRDVATALEKESADRRERFTYAEAHYGVDEGVYALDERTLVVQLSAPTPYFLDIVAFYSSHPVPRHVVEVPGNEQDWFMPDKIVSNGPFRLQSWRVNEKIRLVKSETYWDAAHTRLDVIDAYSIENRTTSLNLYLTGAMDWLPAAYPPDLVDELKPRSDFYANPGLVVYYYRFNCTRPPLDDPRVRQALSLGIDRQLIVDEVLRLGQLPAYHLVPPGLAGYDRPVSKLGRDVERARALLAEAGFPDGRGWPEGGGGVSILYNTDEGHKKMAEVVADQLRRNLNIKITAYNQEWQAYQASMLKLDYWMARATWIGDYVDPNTFMDMWVTNGGNNQTGWGNPLYDRLIRSAANVAGLLEESDSLFAKLKEPEKARALLASVRAASTEQAGVLARAKLRMHLFREAEAILVQDEFPILPVYFYVVSGLVKPYVQGFYSTLELPDGSKVPNLQDIHPLRGLWIEREGASR